MKSLIIRVKHLFKPLFNVLRKMSPGIYYQMRYFLASRKTGNIVKQRDAAFNSLIEDSSNKKCLQIGVKENVGAKYGQNWVSVDRFDMRDFIDYHYDIHDLKFDDAKFDVIVCISILEHVPYPQKAIKELRRVLKPGGVIWVQLPFNYPYHGSPEDYWRVSPDGLRVWMNEFEEILCGSFLFCRTSLVTSTFFYGRKPSNG